MGGKLSVVPLCYPWTAPIGFVGQPSVVYMYMKRTNIYLREDHLKRLKAISDQTGAPVSFTITMATYDGSLGALFIVSFVALTIWVWTIVANKKTRGIA